ncbi:hypothetical protein RhiirA5_435468 [Rhizophagus irregularis]|uniref:Uncharacterized protein n=1 Tax=Rhizophagus irregularis TaxID=588596 RepID=A0A2N0NND9_9GLOM|nr:hypothetical protein RhiirA5_435468 [Rhizophagus irregularis]PKC61907.1 hypothetical protein RhiirA1_465864 [Rhizophagus irregularis]
MNTSKQTSEQYSVTNSYKLSEDSNPSLSVFSLFNCRFVDLNDEKSQVIIKHYDLKLKGITMINIQNNELKVHIRNRSKSFPTPVIYQEISNNQLRNPQIHIKLNFTCKNYNI